MAAAAEWLIRGRSFGNCNCDYGCPCQFSAAPTHGHCRGVMAIEIDEGYHGAVRLDHLRLVCVFAWPGPIHEGGGEGLIILDERADAAQREALLRIARGADSEPGANVFQVFSSTIARFHEPIVSMIEFDVDIAARRAAVVVPGLLDSRGEPILNPVTGEPHRVRIDMPEGFEYRLAEIGRGWSRISGAMPIRLSDSYGQFTRLNLTGHGVVD